MHTILNNNIVIKNMLNNNPTVKDVFKIGRQEIEKIKLSLSLYKVGEVS